VDRHDGKGMGFANGGKEAMSTQEERLLTFKEAQRAVLESNLPYANDAVAIAQDAKSYAAGVAEAEAKYAGVLIELESWKATAEELADKNVNKTLAQRHEMREARTKAKYVKLVEAAVKYHIEYHRHTTDTSCRFCNVLDELGVKP